MRTRLPILLLTAAFSLTGCELLVRFDPSLIDGSVDASVDHVAADVQHPDVPPSMDVVDVVVADATDVTPMDVVMTDATDVTPTDVVITDATDATPMDAQPDAQPDVTDAGTDVGTAIDAGTDSGTIADTGTDAGTPDTGTPDADTGVADTGTADSGATQPAYNGCTYTTAVDARAMATPTITFPGSGATLLYTPSCIRITAGQTVTFTADAPSDFAGHPLVPGNQTTMAVESGTPITTTSTGTTVMFTFPTAGAYGFYCQFHASMAGIVYVDP